MTDYSDHPLSVTELRGNKTDNPNDSLPRDALIYLLREIDSGRMNIEHVIICVKMVNEEPNDCDITYVNGGKLSPLSQLGLVSATVGMITRDL